MDLEEIASKLRGARRKRTPMATASRGHDRESADRIHSAVASNWMAAVAASPRRAPSRPQSSPRRSQLDGKGAPQHRANKPCNYAIPSWVRGNPYAKAFPRARVWTREHVPGLSGKKPPSGWNAEAEQEEFKQTETREDISAKDLYHELVTATSLERKAGNAQNNPSTKGIAVDTDAKCSSDEECPEGVAPSHELRAHFGETTHRELTADDEQHSAIVGKEELLDVSDRDATTLEARGNQFSSVRSTPPARHTANNATEDDLLYNHYHRQKQQQRQQQGKSELQGLSPSARESNSNDALGVNGLESSSRRLAVPPSDLYGDSQFAHLTEERADADRADHSSREGIETSAASISSKSTSDFISSSGSSISSDEDQSCFDDDSDEAAIGILEDFTEGVDSWLDDVHGAGREAFFGLFKRDATPQFCRPSLGVIGRHGIGSSFIDGEPNMKYLPQRPVELHEIPVSWPPDSPPPQATVHRRGSHSTRGRSMSPGRQEMDGAAAGVTTPSVSKTPGGKNQASSPKIPQVRRARTNGDTTSNGSAGQQSCPPAVSISAAPSHGRPHSSPAMHSASSRRKEDGGRVHPPDTLLPHRIQSRNEPVVEATSRVQNEHAEGDGPEQSTLRRPQTADGRGIEIVRHQTPSLDDPTDPVMIAHKRMKRPLSPRRDFLMRCAEQQLMPVPVINRALKLDPNTTRNVSATGDTNQCAEARQGKNGDELVENGGGLSREGQQQGSIVLRHYYLGKARTKCLESAISSVAVALTEVELVDSGLDDLASEALFGVLLARVGTISKLHLGGNRIGVRGATVLGRFIAHNDCTLKSLKLDGNKAGDQAITAVLIPLARHQPPLSHLDLSDNRLTLKTMQACAARLLTGGLPLLSLDLGWNHLNQQAVEHLSDALAWNKSVTKMNLEFNSSGEGVHALAETLQTNNTLTRLDLTGNQVRWRGAVALSEAMVASTGIRSLVLRENPIGTAAGLQMGIALVRKSGTPCLVDIKGCTCFSDKTDVWSLMKARMSIARAERLALTRERNAAIRARNKLRKAKKTKVMANKENEEKRPNTRGGAGAGGSGSGSKSAPSAKSAPPPLPPPIRPDEQLYWLDLTVDREWNLHLNKPFDRAIGVEALKAFNFSADGSLVGVFRATGAKPRTIMFRRRRARTPAGSAPPTSRGHQGRAGHVKTAGTIGKLGKTKRKAGNMLPSQGAAEHPLAPRLHAWAECMERCWEGDVPPIQGLSLREEVDQLLAQLPTEGTLKLSYKAGEPLAPKQSLLLGTAHEETFLPEIVTNTSQYLHLTRDATRPDISNIGRPTTREKEGSGLPSSAAGDGPLNHADRRSRASDGAFEGGFQGLIYMLRSLGSPTQMCEMVECLSRRTWLTDDQLYAVLRAFSDEPKMSEPRCRVFLALLPNIRHNCLKAIGRHLSQCVKRLQGIPLPDLTVKPPPKMGAAAIRARALAIGQKGRDQVLDQRMKNEKERKEREDEEAKRRADVFNHGWKEGPYFKDLSGAVGVLAGCAVSMFRRFGLEHKLTPLETSRLGSVVEGSAQFNPFAPQGHYNLDMTMPGDVHVFRSLLLLDKVNRAHVGIQGLLDPSQHGNFHHLRNFRLGGGRPVKFGLLSRRARAKMLKKTKKKKKKNAPPKKIDKTSPAKRRTGKVASIKRKAKPGSTKEKPQSARKGGKGTKGAASPTRRSSQGVTGQRSGSSEKPAFVKRYPTIPTVSRVSFDFLQYIRPSPGTAPVPKESFEQLVDFLTSWDCCSKFDGGTISCRGTKHEREAGKEVDDGNLEDRDVNDDGGKRGDGGFFDDGDGTMDDRRLCTRSRDRFTLNLLRHVCHVFYFDCNQVVNLLRIFPGEDDERDPAKSAGLNVSSSKDKEAPGKGTSYREEAFVIVFCRITDEKNLDLCLGMLTDTELSRCEARLGPVALFMPTKPEGDYKLDLRDFADRQILTLLLELERSDPVLQLLGMRHDGKYLEECCASWVVPKRGRFRTRAVSRRAFKSSEELAASETARWEIARSRLGWHDRPSGVTPSHTTPTQDAPILRTRPKTPPPTQTGGLPPGVGGGDVGRAVDANTVDLDEEDRRPRKRAVVRIHRKEKVKTLKHRGLKHLVDTPRRAKSFSHLPQPRLYGEELIEYLGRMKKADTCGASNSPGESAGGGDVGREAPEAVATVRTKKDEAVGDENGQAPASIAKEDIAGVEGGDNDSNNPSKSIPRRRYIRRWPSSADIGMFTDGR